MVAPRIVSWFPTSVASVACESVRMVVAVLCTSPSAAWACCCTLRRSVSRSLSFREGWVIRGPPDPATTPPAAYPLLQPHPDLRVREGGQVAFSGRKKGVTVSFLLISVFTSSEVANLDGVSVTEGVCVVRSRSPGRSCACLFGCFSCSIRYCVRPFLNTHFNSCFCNDIVDYRVSVNDIVFVVRYVSFVCFPCQIVSYISYFSLLFSYLF